MRHEESHRPTRMRSRSPSPLRIGSTPRPRYNCKRKLAMSSVKPDSSSAARKRATEPTHGVPSSSCSAAGSLSSNRRSSSLSRLSSACLLVTALSASFSALARDSRVPSRWLRFVACFSAEGTLGGRVEDVRAASRTRARAAQA